jgi:hypothetical protein
LLWGINDLQTCQQTRSPRQLHENELYTHSIRIEKYLQFQHCAQLRCLISTAMLPHTDADSRRTRPGVGGNSRRPIGAATLPALRGGSKVLGRRGDRQADGALGAWWLPLRVSLWASVSWGPSTALKGMGVTTVFQVAINP